MTEREIVLLKREAVREWYRVRADDPDSYGSDWLEAHLRKTFPLPAVRVPRVVRGPDHKYRIAPEGHLEWADPRDCDGEERWHLFRSKDFVAALRDLLAHPWVEQPSPEEEG